MKPRILTSLPLFVVLTGLSGTALATNRTWVGTTSDWATTSNWNPAALPGAGDALTFNDTAVGTSVTKVSASGSSLSLTFSGVKSFTFTDFGGAGLYAFSNSALTSTSSVTQTLPYLRLSYNSNGNVTLANNGTGLLSIGNAQKEPATASVTGDIIFSGTGNYQVTKINTRFNYSTNLQKTGSGTLTLTGTASFPGASGSNVSGLVGITTVTGGTLKITSGNHLSLGQAKTGATNWLTLNGGALPMCPPPTYP